MDVGTGKGHLVEAIIKKARELGKAVKYIGVDNKLKVPSGIKTREAENENEKGGFGFVVADAVELPAPDKSVDGVSFFFSFHHMKEEADIRKSLREALRVIKDGGKIFVAEDIIETSQEQDFATKIDRSLEFYSDDEVNRKYYHKSLSAWQKIFDDFGLNILETREFDTKYGGHWKGKIRHKFFVLEKRENKK